MLINGKVLESWKFDTLSSLILVIRERALLVWQCLVSQVVYLHLLLNSDVNKICRNF